MTDVVALISNAIDIVGKLRALSKKVEDAEFKMLLAELSGELADAKLEVAHLKIEVAKLTTENQDLLTKAKAKASGRPTLSDGAYCFAGEEGHFCTACYDTRQQRVLLTKLVPPFSDFGRWECPACHAILS